MSNYPPGVTDADIDALYADGTCGDCAHSVLIERITGDIICACLRQREARGDDVVDEVHEDDRCEKYQEGE